DYLEIPNLRARSTTSFTKWLAGKHPAKWPWQEERAQLVYAVASIIFSATLLMYVYAALYTWSTSRWKFAGLVGFLMFSTVTLRKTAVESWSGLRAVVTR